MHPTLRHSLLTLLMISCALRAADLSKVPQIHESTAQRDERTSGTTICYPKPADGQTRGPVNIWIERQQLTNLT